MGTVGIVEWSIAGGTVSEAEIEFSLKNADSGILNKGGVAPVDLDKPNHRTLLLGLKQNKIYAVIVKASLQDGLSCQSGAVELETASLYGSPNLSNSVMNASKQMGGFILTCGGVSLSMPGGGVSLFLPGAVPVLMWRAI